jgi:death on curing protein
VNFPTRELIVFHNFNVIKATKKGFFVPPENLLNPNSLEWVLNYIQYPIFGEYNTIEEKASLLCWTIIVDHVFNDGNKRTGMVSMESFLAINGYFLRVTVDEIVNIALYVADSRNQHDSKQNLTNWIIQHHVQL